MLSFVNLSRFMNVIFRNFIYVCGCYRSDVCLGIWILSFGNFLGLWMLSFLNLFRFMDVIFRNFV
jgi:hypothetical protein